MKYELSTFAPYPREWVVHGTIAVGVCALVAGASFELGRRSGAGPWEGQAVAWRTAFDLARADASELHSAAIEAARSAAMDAVRELASQPADDSETEPVDFGTTSTRLICARHSA
jgi:hypothetical protein